LVITLHNKSFVEESKFSNGYKLAYKNIGYDYRIPWRVHQAIWAAHNAQKVKGDFVELGTGKGFIMQAVLGSFDNWNKLNKNVWLYDTFLKHNVSGKGKAKYDLYYTDDLDKVKKDFSTFVNVNFIKGDIKETIHTRIPEAISFLHVDLNDGDTEILLLAELMPLVSNGAIIILDDYAYLGEEYAYKLHNDFFNGMGYEILTTPSGQVIIFVIK
jgi:hypothetical protein